MFLIFLSIPVMPSVRRSDPITDYYYGWAMRGKKKKKKKKEKEKENRKLKNSVPLILLYTQVNGNENWGID